MEQHQRKRMQFSGAYFFGALFVLWLLQSLLAPRVVQRPVAYSEFLTHLRAGRVVDVELREKDLAAKVRYPAVKDAKPKDEWIVTDRLPAVDGAPLVAELEKRGVHLAGRATRAPWWQPFLSILIPVALLVVWFVAMRRIQASGASGALSVGKSRAKIYDQNAEHPITFEDVAGVEEAEAEVVEIVGFLKDPGRFRALGAHVPKGVLLVGPPGTGKTLLARAMAGEAGVPFFSLSGSEFIELFVGVGASRMRDLFQEAKKKAPCIVFIDELDAIGKSRAGAGGFYGGHDEREQTLNQLLVEMDGFDPGAGVIIMAATNRPEVLDPALLRAGRFDRQILVDRPDVNGREEILKVHTKKLRLAPDTDIRTVAQRTPGMVGADLANVVNEAAIAAVRRGAALVEQRDFEEAVDRLQLGLKKQGTMMNEEEKRRVAYHESGHTLVALSVKNADPVHRVTIIPRSIGALGATLQLPVGDRYLMTREQLLDRLAVLFGGRAAEQIIFGDTSSGAHDDLKRASELARQMVTRLGMSDEMGPVTYGRSQESQFLGGASLENRDFSEQTAQKIDAAVREILDAQYARAKSLLEERRPVLEAIARRLLEKETLDRDELEALAAT